MMLRKLLKYTSIADQKFIAIFEKDTKCSYRALSVFSHILNAQHIWVSRIYDRTPLYERWQVHSPDQLRLISMQNNADMMAIPDAMPLEKEIRYKTSDGSPYVNTIEEILYHSANHSTYHRGQVAAQFRLDGVEPPVTDFIILNREGNL